MENLILAIKGLLRVKETERSLIDRVRDKGTSINQMMILKNSLKKRSLKSMISQAINLQVDIPRVSLFKNHKLWRDFSIEMIPNLKHILILFRLKKEF